MIESLSKELVLLPLYPKYAFAILSGQKRVEIRRRPPRTRPPFTLLLYATSPVGMLVGTVEVFDLIQDSVSGLWNKYGAETSADHSTLKAYARGLPKLAALCLRRPCRLDPHLRLPRSWGRAPQSYRYFPVHEPHLVSMLAANDATQ
ncbi:MAG: ASCH domain-containing protein [Terriglobales bacterium]